MRSDGVPSRRTGIRPNALYVPLAIFAIAFWFVLGHGHTWVFAALMIAAIRNHRNRWLRRTWVASRGSAAEPHVRPALRRRDPPAGSARPPRAPAWRDADPNWRRRQEGDARS